LHAVATNTTAIRLYELLGFRHRKVVAFAAVRVAQTQVPASAAGRASTSAHRASS
jgi:hypothetical protein